jgi:serine protein kinase
MNREAAEINPKDFNDRQFRAGDVPRAARTRHGPAMKLREVIEEDVSIPRLLPVISFNAKASEDDRGKHENQRMWRGYTENKSGCSGLYLACASSPDMIAVGGVWLMMVTLTSK